MLVLKYQDQHYSTNCNFTKKAIRIVNFRPTNPHDNTLFKRSSITELQDKICLQNIFFVSKSLNIWPPSVLNTCLSFSVDQHNHETLCFTQGNFLNLLVLISFFFSFYFFFILRNNFSNLYYFCCSKMSFLSWQNTNQLTHRLTD